MESPRAVFGNPAVWDSVFAAHESVFRSIEYLREVAKDMVAVTKDSTEEVVQVETALTHICSEAMLDVLYLVGNHRDSGAMKIARGMFEVGVIATYLEQNPNEVHDYLNFAHVETWRHFQMLQKYSPSRVTPEHLKAAEAEYNGVKAQFANAKGRVRARWTDKTVKELAEAVNRLNVYEIAYNAASELHHMPLTGIIAHELDWSKEALFVAHGSLIDTAVSLFNVSKGLGKELENRMQTAIANFKHRGK